MFTISMIRPMILSVVNIIISTDTITMIISIRMARSPSEVDSLDSDLIARTLASIDNEEEEVFIIIIVIVTIVIIIIVIVIIIVIILIILIILIMMTTINRWDTRCPSWIMKLG